MRCGVLRRGMALAILFALLIPLLGGVITAEELTTETNQPTQAEPTEGEPTEGLPTEESTEGEPTEEEPTEEEPTEEEPTEEELTEAEPTEEPTETEPTEPEEELTEEELLAQYDFPEGWSRNALIFAVKNKLMIGDKNNDLRPKGKLTRAELAALMVRLLGASTKEDLSAYTDVSETAWYYEEMSAAVYLGIFKGTTATTLAPGTYITRQEVFTAFARTLGLVAENAETYRVYTDHNQVAVYARNAISALTEQGILHGVGNGRVAPRDPITREEAAQLFYALLDGICDRPEEIPASGRVLYRGSEPLPSELTLDGELILGCGLRGEQTLESCTISGRLLLRCEPGTAVDLRDCAIKELLVAAALNVTSDTEAETLLISGNGAKVSASAQRLHSAADAQITGDFTKVDISAGNLEICGDVTDTVMIRESAEGSTATFHGQVKQIHACADNGTVQGDGYAERIAVHGENVTVTLANGELANEPDYGLEGLAITVTGTAKVTPEMPTVTATATFTGFQAGWGCTEGARTCELRWYLGSTLLRTEESYLLKEGATSSCTYTFNFDSVLPEQQSLRVELICRDDTAKGEHRFAVESYDYYYRNALNTVETVKVEVTALRNTKLYTNSSLSSSFRSIPAGTVMTHYYYPGERGTQVHLADGTFGWIPYKDVEVSKKDYTQKTDYPLGTKEGFVDKKGYSSTTDYLIWVSLKTQRVNVFQGSKGDWTLIKSFAVSTGTNETPTIAGVFKIYYHHYSWRYYAGNYTVFKVTGYHNGHAFHTRPHAGINDPDSALTDPTIGSPSSHGCVRMYDEDAEYIYNLPTGTTVVVY